MGELDIIAMDGSTLVILEVKSHGSSNQAGPETPVLAVGRQKQRRLRRLAGAWLATRHRNHGFEDLRFDVVGITLQLYDHGEAVRRKGACCAGQDIHDARRAASEIGIPHYVLDFESRFKEAFETPLMRFQEICAHHRRERARGDARDDDGRRKSKGEFTE